MNLKNKIGFIMAFAPVGVVLCVFIYNLSALGICVMISAIVYSAIASYLITRI